MVVQNKQNLYLYDVSLYNCSYHIFKMLIFILSPHDERASYKIKISWLQKLPKPQLIKKKWESFTCTQFFFNMDEIFAIGS